MKRTIIILLLVVMLLGLSACKPKTPTPTSAPPATSPPPTAPPPTDTSPPPPVDPTAVPPTEEPTELPPTEIPPTAPAHPINTPLPETEQRLEFESEDGVSLVGSYFPAAVNPSPAVILMHQAASQRGTWVDLGLVAWLRNLPGGGGALFAPPQSAALWPPMSTELSFAVFSFDFREHGESNGVAMSGSDFLVDAKAAFNLVKGLPGVDPERIALIGASIGADAAVDTCVAGCLGGLSLSPGSYLDVSYPEVVAELGLDGKPAWCLASELDSYSANTCRSASGDTYRMVLFPEGGHGEALLVPGMVPDVGQLVLDFLILAFGEGP